VYVCFDGCFFVKLKMYGGSLQDTDIIEVGGDDRLVVKEPKTSVDLTKYTQEHTFVFDQVFDHHSTNQVGLY
jgi:hypothetical protein